MKRLVFSSFTPSSFTLSTLTPSAFTSILLMTVLYTTLGASAFAADTAVQGYLIDVNCSARKARKPGSLTGHGTPCLRMPFCEGTGYGVLTEEKRFIKFNQDGNEKAKKFLASITKANDVKVTVNGTVDGDSMTVNKIELQ